MVSLGNRKILVDYQALFTHTKIVVNMKALRVEQLDKPVFLLFHSRFSPTAITLLFLCFINILSIYVYIA